MYTAMYTLPLTAPVAPWLHLTTVTGASSSSFPRKRASLWRSLTLLDLEPDVGVGNDREGAAAAHFADDAGVEAGVGFGHGAAHARRACETEEGSRGLSRPLSTRLKRATRAGYSGAVEVSSVAGAVAAARCTERQASRNCGTWALGSDSETRKPWIAWQP